MSPRAWRWYTAHLQARPLRTRMITSGVLFTIGDFISQHGIEGRSSILPESWYTQLHKGRSDTSHEDSKSYAKTPAEVRDERNQAELKSKPDEKGIPVGHDYVRTLRLAFYGTFIFAPLSNGWLGMLERFVRIPNRPRLTVVTKVLADLGIWGPFIVSVFWSSNGILEGKPLDQVYQKWSQAFVPSLSKSIMVFGPTQIVNFSLVPVPYRMLVSQCIGLGWNTFLSYSNNLANKRHEHQALLQQGQLASQHLLMNKVEFAADKLLHSVQDGEQALEKGIATLQMTPRSSKDQATHKPQQADKASNYAQLKLDQISI